MSRLVALIALLPTGWPVLRWYGLRLQDGSDEPLGLVAFAVACMFTRNNDWREELSPPLVLLLVALLAGYVGLYPWMPALARALVFVVMIALVAAPKKIMAGWMTLLMLSLPLVSTLQFYLGYPLRLPTTQLSALLLRCCGVAAHADGTTLLWAGERVIVDAPCSGIQMAWTGLFVAATLSCWQGLSSRETFRLFRWAGGIVFCANVFRAAALFLMGAGIWRLPPFAHEGIGLVLFAGAIWLIYFRAVRLQSSWIT